VFFTTKAEDKYMEVAAGAIVAKAMYNLWVVEYLNEQGIDFKIKNKLDVQGLWKSIKDGKIIIKDKDSFIKDWTK
jgi:ABC-type proline/glycine betaine transport system substrate-binding protein